MTGIEFPTIQLSNGKKTAGVVTWAFIIYFAVTTGKQAFLPSSPNETLDIKESLDRQTKILIDIRDLMRSHEELQKDLQSQIERATSKQFTRDDAEDMETRLKRQIILFSPLTSKGYPK